MNIHAPFIRGGLPSEAETCDPHIVTAAGNANDLLKLVQVPKYREYLRQRNSIFMLEEAFDQLREVLDVLNRSDA